METEGPGIDGFQIIGEAIPGEKVLGCGFPVRGTTLCMFQVKSLLLRRVFENKLQELMFVSSCKKWVRHLEDGTRQYIEGKDFEFISLTQLFRD